MLSVSNLSKSFPDKKLFENVNLNFSKGNTYGIIGANGAGKSTFLKIVAGEIESTKGDVFIPKNKRISILKQEHSLYDKVNVTEAVIQGNKELEEINNKKNEIYMNPEATEKDFALAAELEEEYGQKGGWTAESDAQILLDGLGIDKNKWDKKVEDLKSGEKFKVLLAQALFGNPDILLLDEPSNHLDLKAIKWLEKFLAEYENLVLIISHDSDLLDQVCTHIVDIDFGGAKMYTGNYSFWKQSSQLALELQQKQNAKAEEKIKALKEFVERFSANASKSSQATSRKKALEKINIDEIKPSNRKYPFIRFDINRDPGKDILRVEDLTYITPDNEVLFENVTFSIHNGEKVALIGQDDIAKTKFLEILMGITKPTSGKVTWGVTITPDYFPSNNDLFFEKKSSLLDWISQWPLENKEGVNKDNSDSRMRSFLGRMLFSNDSVFKNIQDCSGGEKARLMFAKMMLKESNCLLFDQPLDHLDTESIDSVIEGIKNYKSSLMFVTHNRTLVRKCSNVIVELKNNSSFIFRGSLEEYEKKMGY